jgi:hypothetical protein
MDLREVRKQFINKQMAYACSYDPELFFDWAVGIKVAEGLRVTLGQRVKADSRAKVEPLASTGTPAVVPHSQPEYLPIGNIFHVLDAISVTGVDQRNHDCPVGKIEHIDESILFRSDSAVGVLEGRMTFVTDDKATIDATYKGVLHFREPPLVAVESKRILEAGAWVVPLFVTTDSRYRWLADRACAAFGTWVAEVEPRVGPSTRKVTARLDVYSLG